MRALAGAAGLALAVTGLAVAPAGANPGSTGLVISEVYGGGGNAGATYSNDFIELYNPTGAAISVAGMSVQYRSAAGTSAQVTELSGSAPAGGHYLVQEGAGATPVAALPTPDATGAIAMAGTGGVVLLVPTTTAFTATGDLAGDAGLIDMVGYGTTPTSFETANTGVALTNSTAASRNAAGADSDNNANDFSELAPAPQNTGGVTPPVDEFTGTIAQIQGTDTATSPHVGDIATTEGVVTAAYPTGGFNGFFIQTVGTGGGADATPGASDAIFVYGSAATATVATGDHVQVVGLVKEFAGTTEIETDSAGDITHLGAATAPTALATELPATETAREAHEGELLAPTGPFTVTNTYSTNQYAEIGLAAGTTPLIAPTEIEDAQTGDIAGVTAANAARAITLDDGASINFLSAANQAIALPWLSTANPVRVGAPASFTGPVILDYRNNLWKFQPTSQITGTGSGTATFANTRTPAPENVGGDIRLATFNVLNYFPTTGEEYVASGLGTCTYYNDRAGNPITNNTCSNNGPRGAADAANLARQQAKTVDAINKLGASIVSLEEIENSVQFGKNRDFAVMTLVNALNVAAGSEVWAYAPSPAAADLPLPAQEDVIRTAFIYKSADVALVGPSEVLIDETNFDNAREPLAQAFKPVGTTDADAFSVIVNHFKSKGSGPDDGTGQGNSNPDRIGQAQALDTFATSFATDRGTDEVFLTGDFNSYSMEDPMQVLYGAGYTALESDTAGEETYSFSGLSGSLDHVLANDAALAMVTGADVWSINSGESVGFEYSRFNYNVTDLYEAGPFRASDHDPEIIGLDVAEAPSPTVEFNLLGVNDFHGRINANTVKWAGTVEQLTDGKEANTLLVGAGDLIGASEFASSVQQDQPTIDVMNALGLDASAVGNHEFDQGFADLRDRVIGPDGDRNALWDYLGANVYLKGTQTPALPEYALFEIDGVSVAVVGAVTQETATLVSPGGITEIDFGNPVDAVNRVAGELSDGNAGNGEADVIVASFHAGAQKGVGSTYEAEIAKGGEFAEMANLDADVDAIFNGHTHQVYAFDAPKPGGGNRPILQTGEYASNVGEVVLTYDRASGEVTSYTARNVARTTVDDAVLTSAYPRVAEVKQIVDAATAFAAQVGNQPVGQITDDITRAYSNGSYVNGEWVSPTPRTEDRGAESALGDLVGNALRDGIPADIGEADLGIVNPGGMRTDLIFAGNTGSNPANTDGVVTYAEANSVLPFVNNIWLIDVTGAQLKDVLEQQWQTNPGGPAPSRPYLQLGLSDNVEVTSDAAQPAGSRITSVRIDGTPIDPTATYTVSTFSFLGTGGDNFRAFTLGTHRDTGLVDRDLWIGYLQDTQPIAPDFARQQVFETGKPASVKAGDAVQFTLGPKLDLISLGSPANTTVAATGFSGGAEFDLGDFAVTNGAADISFTVPAGMTEQGRIELVAGPSGTTVTIPVTPTVVTPIPTSVSAAAGAFTYGTDGTVDVTVTPATAGGTVTVLDGTQTIGTATLSGGSAQVTIPGTALQPGNHTLTVDYGGDATHTSSTTTVTVQVDKAASTTAATAYPSTVTVGTEESTVTVAVNSAAAEPTGSVEAYVDGSLVDSDTLSGGMATLTVGPFDTVGTATVEVRYLGDNHVAASQDTASVEVVPAPEPDKLDPSIFASHSPTKVQAGKTRATLRVTVSAEGVTPTGWVRVVIPDHDTRVVKLENGKLKLKLPTFDRAGEKTLEITYDGNDEVESGSIEHVITVVRR